MSIKRNTVEDLLWEAISQLVKVPLMFADQKVSIPESGVYGTLKIISGPTKNGKDSQKYSTDMITVEGNRELTLSVNFYRKGALELCDILQSFSQSEIFRTRLFLNAKAKDMSVSIFDVAPVQNLTALIQSDYEERGQVDIFFRVISKIDFKFSTIDSANISSTIKHHKENDVDQIEDNFTIP